MGAQTSQSLAATRDFVASAHGDAMAMAQGLFAAAVGLSGSQALQSQLSDSSTDVVLRQKLATTAFATLSDEVKDLISRAVALRWSRAEDLQAALEDMAIRLCALSDSESTDLVGELLAISDFVHSNADVELGLGSKRASPQARATLMKAFTSSQVSPQASAIAQHLVTDPRGRRIGAMLYTAAEVVADQHGKGLAIVRVATPLNDAQNAHIEAVLEATFHRPHYVAERIDISVVGGARIRVGDTVIDGSIASRLKDLRTQLAG